jgi:hypothetical protein
MISGVLDGKRPDYRRERQEFFRPRRIDMDRIWELFGFMISVGS